MAIERSSSEIVPRDIQSTLDMFFGDIKTVGVSYLGHGVVSDRGDHTGYFSNKEWGQVYMQNQYFFAEPILQLYEKEPLSLIPWVSVEDCNSIAQLRNERAQLTSGLTICRKEDGFNTFFNIGLNENVNIIDFSFFKRDVLLAYFTIFNNCHLRWRKEKGF
jgi:hypothetical protein